MAECDDGGLAWWWLSSASFVGSVRGRKVTSCCVRRGVRHKRWKRLTHESLTGCGVSVGLCFHGLRLFAVGFWDLGLETGDGPIADFAAVGRSQQEVCGVVFFFPSASRRTRSPLLPFLGLTLGLGWMHCAQDGLALAR
jgi:hypothetical protein